MKGYWLPMLGALLVLAAATCQLQPPAPSVVDRPVPPPVAPAPRQNPTPPDGLEREPADEGNPVLVGEVVRIVDGDTMHVLLDSGDITVRFHSIDAPEKDQPWGQKAKKGPRPTIEW